MAKLETIKPTKVLDTPKVRAKIGMAGIIRPNPIATRNEIEARTETSRGRPRNGERSVGMFIRAPLQLHLVGQQHELHYLAAVFRVRRWQRRMPEPRQEMPPKKRSGMLT